MRVQMDTNEIINQADRNYHPYPSFKDWAVLPINLEKWNRYASNLKTLSGSASSEQLKTAFEQVKRVTAIETGAIEGLYEVDRGFTITAAATQAVWEAAINAREGRTRSLVEAQLKAYDYVLDLATEKAPFSEAHIRELHKVICSGQSTYRVFTDAGWQEQELPLGEYKKMPNHVWLPDNTTHSYAPVLETPHEVRRLCDEVKSDSFGAAHPVLQASYVHYALVAIHPFADGNGRLSRALASVFTYRANSVPLLITNDTKLVYFDSLKAADEGQYQPFADYIFSSAISSMHLVEESLRTAELPSLEETLKSIRDLYTTKRGYSFDDVDKAGYAFFDKFVEVVKAQLHKINVDYPDLGQEQGLIGGDSGKYSDPSYTKPHTLGDNVFRFSLMTKPPASAVVVRRFQLELPVDIEQNDTLLIRSQETNDRIEAQITEVWPKLQAALEIRITLAVERVLSLAIQELRARAIEALNKSKSG